jgi:peroxiredoxin
MPLQPGDPAPDVRLPSHTLETVSLADQWSGQPLVVLFFPLAFTSTCTEELCTIGDDLSAYREMSARVVAISVDSPWSLDRYRRECGVEFPFLSDFNREATEAFGVLRTSPLGPGLLNVSDRAVFVIAPDGRVAYTWHAINPSLLPPFEEVKEAVRRVSGVNG